MSIIWNSEAPSSTTVPKALQGTLFLEIAWNRLLIQFLPPAEHREGFNKSENTQGTSLDSYKFGHDDQPQV